MGSEMCIRDSTRTPCKLLVLQKAHFARITKIMPTLKTRLQEFYDLREKKYELARLAAADRVQRHKYERRARLRDQSAEDGLVSAFIAESEDADDSGVAADAEEVSEEQQAATCVQRVWRGTQTRAVLTNQ